MNARQLAALIVFLLFTSTVAEARAPRIGETLPVFQLPGLSGKNVDSGRYAGKTLVIYFWTDACGCKAQLLELRPFVAGLRKRQAAFLAINAGQEKVRVERFAGDNKLPYEFLLDEKAQLAMSRFGLKVLPTIFVVSRDGVVRERLIGVVDTKKLQSIIGRYL